MIKIWILLESKPFIVTMESSHSDRWWWSVIRSVFEYLYMGCILLHPGRCCSHRRRSRLYQTPQNNWDCPVSTIFCLAWIILSSLCMPCTWRSCVSQSLIPELRQLEIHGNGLLWLYEDCICWMNSAILMKSGRLECFFLLIAKKRPHQRPPTRSLSWIRKTGPLLICSLSPSLCVVVSAVSY